jgi:phosphatidate cytidylyltransferase
VSENLAPHNSAPADSRNPDYAPGFRAIRWNNDWVLRPLFGLTMAVLAIAAVFALAPRIFSVLIMVLLIPAAREWHRMVAQNRLEPVRLHLLTAVTVAAASVAVAMLLSGMPLLAVLPILVGAIVAYLLGQQAGPLWQAAGVLYLGLPALALVAVRAFPDPARGARIVVGMFFIVWATDTGALVFGNLIGGPRLAPKLSPGKTWAGTIGGSLTAAFVYACYVALLGGPMELAAAFALVFSAVAHGGDLAESFVKRRFGFKDSGSAIPGHGGVLDRIDSTLACALAMALLVFGFHLNPLFWGHM